MTRVHFLFVACLAGIAGCGDTATTPTPTTPTTFTEVFNGTINQNGASSHAFVSQASGTVTATLTALMPDSTQVVGVSLGTWTGSACQIVVANDKATQFTAVGGAVGSAGSLCARVYDVGTIGGGPVTYELTVVHP